MNQMHSPLDDEALSAWIDGELSPEETQALSDRWDTDDKVRAAWHRYHWLGDSLRSQDLARRGVAHDTAFVREWRLRRDADAVQPSPVSNPVSPIRQNPFATGLTPDKPYLQRKTFKPGKPAFWGMAWAAAAAGVMVSGAFWVTQRGVPTDAVPMMVDANSALVRQSDRQSVPSLLPRVSTHSPPATTVSWEERSAAAASSQVVIRDPQLDAYLFAHDPFSRLSRPGQYRQGTALTSSITRIQAASAGQ